MATDICGLFVKRAELLNLLFCKITDNPFVVSFILVLT